MELAEATKLIKPAFTPSQPDQVWSDLGAGGGLFTRAMAILLGQGSTIHAVDRYEQNFEPFFNGNRIVFYQLDFSRDALPFSDLDGILMANSLHFVKDQVSLLLTLRKHLRRNGKLVIVEYELDKGNQWVPFPIPYARLSEQLTTCGFRNTRIIGGRQSAYGGRRMYACVAVNA